VLRVRRILAPNPGVFTLEGTNTWVVGASPSVVIDPGPADAEHLDDVLREAGGAGSVGAVVVTHDHEDHAEGALAFADAARATLFGVRAAGADPLHDRQRFAIGAGGASGPVDAGAVLIAVATPGHSADHVVFHEPDARALFTGDAVLGRGTSFIDPPDGDLVHYLRSLERMAELAPRTIYPGHGPVVLDAAAKLQEYVEHRAERERQILEELTGGALSIADLVARIYAEHPVEVRPLAARSVTAHLRKLDAEGRVDKRGRGDEQRWSAVEARSCARCGRPVKGRGRYCGPCSLALLQDTAADG